MKSRMPINASTGEGPSAKARMRIPLATAIVETPVSSVGLRPHLSTTRKAPPHHRRAGELDEAVYHDRGERVGDAHLRDNGRAVVDDGVDASYLDQEAEPDDERSGQPEVPLEELAEAALLLVGEVLFDTR